MIIGIIATINIKKADIIQSKLLLCGFDDVIVFFQEKPIGIGLAKQTACNIATETYGYDNHYLIIDDDAHIDEDFDIVPIAEQFKLDDKLGIICIPMGVKEKKDNLLYTIKAHNTLLIKGEILKKIKFNDLCYYTSVDFGLQAILNGYTIATTELNYIKHDISPISTHITNNVILPNNVYYETKKINGFDVPIISSIKLKI